MANNLTIGVLRALLTLDQAQFQSGMREAAGSASKFQSDMRKLGSNLTTIGTQWTAAISAPIIGGFALAGKAAIDFESSFAGVRKTVSASKEVIDGIGASFREMSTRIPVSVNDLNQLGETAGALGIPAASIAGFTEVMAKLGVTTNVTSDQAANSIAKIQNIFGAAGVGTKNFASTLVALGNNGASTEAEILALAERISSAGNTVGLTQAQVLGFAAAIANVGMDAEAGGSAMSRTFIEISQAVSKGGQDLAGFANVAGMSSTQFATMFKTNAAGAVEAFIHGLGTIKAGGGDLNATLAGLGITELRQSDLLRRLAGDHVNAGAAISLANDAWRENSALDTEAGTRFGTTASQLTVLKNQFSEVALTLGNSLKPMLDVVIGFMKETVLPVVQSLATTFAGLPMPIQLAAVAFGLLLAAAGPLLIIIGQLSLGLSALAGLGGFSGILALAEPLIAFFTVTLPGAFMAILPYLGPIGLIAAGVAAVYFAWKYWDEIVAFFKGAWQFVVSSVKDIPGWILPALGPIGLVLATFKYWDQISAIAQAVFTAVKTWLVDKFTAIVESIKAKIDAVTGFFRNMYDKVVGNSYVPDMVAGIGASFGQLDDVMVTPTKRSTGLVTGLFHRLDQEVTDIVSSMLRKVSSALTGWLDSFMPSWAAKLLGGLADDLIGGLTKKFLPGLSGSGGLGGMLGGGGGGILGKIPGLSGLLGGGAGAASGITAGAGINATLDSLGGGAAAAGGGGMGAIGGLLTNPFTIAAGAAALLGWGIWKKGLFRGGWEGVEGNKRRDQFIAQWGPPGTGAGSGFQNLASWLTSQTGEGGGGRLFADLLSGDKKRFEGAESTIVSMAAAMGKHVQAFNQGGFIPPGIVQPAILHGGSQGEVIAPLDKLWDVGGKQIQINNTIVAWDSHDVRRAMPTLIREWKKSLLLNEDGIVTAHRRALEA